MKLALSLALLIGASIFPAVSQEYFIDQINGHKDIKLGSNISDYKILVPFRQNNVVVKGLTGFEQDWDIAHEFDFHLDIEMWTIPRAYTDYYSILDKQIDHLIIYSYDDVIFEIGLIVGWESGLLYRAHKALAEEWDPGFPVLDSFNVSKGSFWAIHGKTTHFFMYHHVLDNFIKFWDVKISDLHIKRNLRKEYDIKNLKYQEEEKSRTNSKWRDKF